MKVRSSIAANGLGDEPGWSLVEEVACRTASSTMTMATSTTSQQQKQKQKALEAGDELPLRCVSTTLPVLITDDQEAASGPESKQPMTATRFMTFVGMAFLWTSAQIPTYFWGGIPPIVYGALGGTDRWVWLITGNLLASAAVCPFVGALSDMLGRRYVALLGCGLVVAGQLVCTCAGSMNMFIAGMAVSGAGAGINELTALAGTAEIAPTAQRGAYIALLIASVLPFTPAVLWAQLLAARAGWRAVGVLTAVYGFVGLLVVAISYHPPPRTAPQPATHTTNVTHATHATHATQPATSPTPAYRHILFRLDWLGGLLSTAGTVLLVAGLLWGGYPYGWGQAHVLAPLLLGLVLLGAFVAWEAWGIPAMSPETLPMVPARLFRTSARTLALALVVTFVSGANFFSVLMLWPSQAYNVYGHDPVGVGLRGLPFALGVLVGCAVTLAVLTRRRGGNRPLLFCASAVMTAGCGALAAARPDNLVPAVYIVLAIAGVGVGGIVVPPSLVATVICPNDLIATATALTLAVRVAGGAVGYSLYYNVFVRQLVPRLETRLGDVLFRGLAATNSSAANPVELLGRVIRLTAASQTEAVAQLPGIDASLARSLVVAGQQAYADAYPYVYYASIGFGVVSMLASLFMDDIGPYMDDHVAVVIA